MHEIGTVRTSLVFRELLHIRDIVEESLCPARPYWIFHRPSKNGCWPSYGVLGTATCSRCMSCCCAPPVGRRPGLRSPILLALECLPHCERLQRPRACRPVRRPDRAGGQDVRAAPVAASQPGSITQEGAGDLRVVPHAVELRDAGGATHAPAGHRGLVLDHAALAARAGLGMEAG